jgi:outer membrane protein assembly factor BamB
MNNNLPGTRSKRPLQQRSGIAVTVVFLVLLVGSLAFAVSQLHQSKSSDSSHPRTAGLHSSNVGAQNQNTRLNVYAALGSTVYKLTAKTGKLLWSFEAKRDPNTPPALSESFINNAPLVVDGVAYVCSQNGNIYALDASNGTPLWTFHSKTETTLLTIAGGLVYANGLDWNTNNSYLYTINASDGTLHQHYNMQGSDGSAVAALGVLDKVIYAVSTTGLYAFDAASSKQLWRTPISSQQNYSAPQLIDGVLYIASSEISHHSATEPQDSYEYAYNPTNGAMLWRSAKVNGFILSTPTIVNGAVYFGAQDGYAYALNARDGSLLWRVRAGGPVYPSPKTASRVVYIGETSNSGDNDFIIALNAADGSMRWYKKMRNYLGDPLAMEGGVLYFGTWDGVVHALNASDGTQLWSHKISKSKFPPGGGVAVTVAP